MTFGVQQLFSRLLTNDSLREGSPGQTKIMLHGQEKVGLYSSIAAARRADAPSLDDSAIYQGRLKCRKGRQLCVP